METTSEKIKKMPVCNEALYKKVSLKTKLSPKQVEEIISYVSKYTNKVIATGAFETVMIPGFGKFKVRERMVQHLEAEKTKTELPI